MEYDEDDIDYAGKVPECGAIFMSNTATKRECLRRKILGLPYAEANFVRQVKAGMVLFLFEFEKRELHGVFRACSDGAMNIIPDAFSSSGKQFPAQVRFTPIWYCNPLSEHEFRDAIRENYFSAKKFYFGLSEDQVHRLLSMFSSRKLNDKLPQRQFSRQVTKSNKKYRKVVHDGRIVNCDRIETEAGVDNDCASKDPRESVIKVGRAYDDWFLRSDRLKDEHHLDNSPVRGISTEYREETLAKIRRVDDGGRFLNDATQNERNMSLEWVERPVVPSIERRFSDDKQFLINNRLDSEHILDNNIYPFISAGFPENSLGRGNGLADNGLLCISDRIGKESNVGIDIGSVISTKHLSHPFCNARREIDDSKFLRNNGVENECHVDHDLQLAGSSEHHGNLWGKVGRTTDDGSFLMHDRVVNESHVNTCVVPAISNELHGNTLATLGKTTKGRFLGSDRVVKEHDYENVVEPIISNNYFDNSLYRTRRTTNDGMFSMNRSLNNELIVDNGLGPFISSDPSGYALGMVKGADDNGTHIKSDKLEKGRVGDCFRPVISSDYSDLSQSKNSFPHTTAPIFEKSYPFLQDRDRHSPAFNHLTEPQIFDISHQTGRDAITTRAVPYNPEVPKVQNSYSPSFGVDNSFKSLQDCSPYYSSAGIPFSSFKNQLSPYQPEAKGSSICLDFTSSCGNDVHFTTSNSYYGSNGAISSVSCPENMEMELSKKAFVPSSRCEVHQRESMAPSPYTSKDPSELSDTRYSMTLKGKYKHKTSWLEGTGSFLRKDFESPGECRCHLIGLTSSGSLGIHCPEKDSNNHAMEFFENTHFDSQKGRGSVFSRLTSASESCFEENDTLACYDENDMDASVDEVMEMLKQSQNQYRKKIRKFYPSVRAQDDATICNTRKCYNVCSSMDYNQSMTTVEMQMDTNLPVEGTDGLVAKETRVIDFKRRSEMKKNQDEVKAQVLVDVGNEIKGSACNAKDEELVGKQCKRRKLVRPVFHKKELSDRGTCSDKVQNLHTPPQESSLCKDNPSSSDNSLKNHGNKNESSDNVMLPASCEGKSVGTEHNLICTSTGCEGNSVSTEHSLICTREKKASFGPEEGQDEKNSSENVDIQNASSPVDKNLSDNVDIQNASSLVDKNLLENVDIQNASLSVPSEETNSLEILV